MSVVYGSLQVACGLYFLWCRIYWNDVSVFLRWPGVFPQYDLSITGLACAVHLVTGSLVLLTGHLGENRVLRGIERFMRGASLYFAIGHFFLNQLNSSDVAFGPLTNTALIFSMLAAKQNRI